MNVAHDGAAFRIGLIQMRSGRSPAANVEAAVRLIDAAKRDGADYVKTPEMTNIMEVKRDKLFAAITAEEQDPSLAAFRDLARRHAIWVHVGSLAVKVSPERAANRSFLIDPAGNDVGVSRSRTAVLHHRDLAPDRLLEPNWDAEA